MQAALSFDYFSEDCPPLTLLPPPASALSCQGDALRAALNPAIYEVLLLVNSTLTERSDGDSEAIAPPQSSDKVIADVAHGKHQQLRKASSCKAKTF